MLTGRILGVNLKVHYLFLLWLVLLASFGQLVYAAILLFSVIVHELGHILTAVNMGIKISEVELMPYGGVARLDGLLGADPDRDAAIALAGPANSLVLLVVGLFLPHKGYGLILMETNLLLLFINLLPILPLDGGRLLLGMLVKQWGVGSGTTLLVHSTKFAAYGLLALCILLSFFGILTINAVALALFVLYSARKERKMLPYIVMKHFSSLPGSLQNKGLLPVKHIAVDAFTPFRQVFDSLAPDHYHMFVMVDRQGKVHFVSEDALFEAIKTHGYGGNFSNLL